MLTEFRSYQSRKQVVFLLLFTMNKPSSAGSCMTAVASPCAPDPLNSMLSDYEVLPLSGIQLHSVRKRDVHTQAHLERLVSFRALHRYSSALMFGTRLPQTKAVVEFEVMSQFRFAFFKSVLK